MVERDNNRITRKDFLKKSCAGLLTFRLFGESPVSLSKKQKIEQFSQEYRTLGRTGIKVIPLGYGASRTQEPSLVKTVLDKGVNFLDTGRSYFNGQNEIMIGKVIKGIRKKVIIQSKVKIRLKENSEELKSAEVSKRIKNIMQLSLNDSLKALQTDYIDILLIHGANNVDIINHESVMEFFRQAKKKGQIRAYGFSSDTNQVELLKAANESNFYDIIMVPYNHKGSYIHSVSGRYKEWNQSALELELKKAHQNNTGLVAMKTCSGGPYSPDDKIKSSYKEALKWVLNHSYIDAMAVAMANRNEINEDVQAII